MQAASNFCQNVIVEKDQVVLPALLSAFRHDFGFTPEQVTFNIVQYLSTEKVLLLRKMQKSERYVPFRFDSADPKDGWILRDTESARIFQSSSDPKQAHRKACATPRSSQDSVPALNKAGTKAGNGIRNNKNRRVPSRKPRSSRSLLSREGNKISRLFRGTERRPCPSIGDMQPNNGNTVRSKETPTDRTAVEGESAASFFYHLPRVRPRPNVVVTSTSANAAVSAADGNADTRDRDDFCGNDDATAMSAITDGTFLKDIDGEFLFDDYYDDHDCYEQGSILSTPDYDDMSYLPHQSDVEDLRILSFADDNLR